MATQTVDQQTRMHGDRLDAYIRALQTDVGNHVMSERLELSRFRDRNLTDAEWELLNGAFTQLRERPVPTEISLGTYWSRVLPTMERERFRVLGDPQPHRLRHRG